MNHKKICLALLVIPAMLAAMFCGCLGGKSEMQQTQMQSFTTTGGSFKAAVISDTQLPPTEQQLREDDTFLQNLKKTLTVLKKNQVDMILFAGDIGDLGTRFAFQTYMDAIDEVFGEEKPIIQTIMGNHDYWNKNVFTAINRKKAFREIIGHSPWTHYVVNGYHFIGASPNSGSMTKGYQQTAEWLDAELQKASADSVGKPVFVMTHNQPEHTSYGSEDWGDKTLDAVLSKYPNAINFSGHVHYPLLDERSIWQGAYTVVNTQSLSYTEMEQGKENGTIPPNAAATPMGYLMEFTHDAIALRRINFVDGETGHEEKADQRWSFPLPYQNDGRYSFAARKAANAAPVMPASGGTAAVQNDRVILSFPAASDDDFVHTYKVVIDGKDVRLFFSDFYNGLGAMAEQVTLELKNLEQPAQRHSFEIYAVDSWGAESSTPLHLETTAQ